jgi:hypothetical protein
MYLFLNIPTIRSIENILRNKGVKLKDSQICTMEFTSETLHYSLILLVALQFICHLAFAALLEWQIERPWDSAEYHHIIKLF